MTLACRQYLKQTLGKLGKENADELMISFDLLSAEIGEDKALDVVISAGKQLLNQCNASTNLPLNKSAQTIYDSLNEFSKSKSVELDGKKLMEKSVNKWNRLVDNVEFRFIHQGKIIGLDDKDLQELRVEIPKALQAKQRLLESYATSDVKSRIKELEISVRY